MQPSRHTTPGIVFPARGPRALLLVSAILVLGLPMQAARAQGADPEVQKLLVIALDFAEVTPQQDIGEIQDWLWGPTVPNLQEYMQEISYGQYEFENVGYSSAWVPAIDLPGVDGDPSTFAWWDGNDKFGTGDIRLHALQSLAAFDPDFDFSCFDTDGNGVVVMPDEVALVVLVEKTDCVFSGGDRNLWGNKKPNTVYSAINDFVERGLCHDASTAAISATSGSTASSSAVGRRPCSRATPTRSPLPCTSSGTIFSDSGTSMARWRSLSGGSISWGKTGTDPRIIRGRTSSTSPDGSNTRRWRRTGGSTSASRSCSPTC